MSLSALRVAVIVFPGSNCDRDMMVAIERLAGRRPSLVWHKETTLDPVDLTIIPGGFSYGDYLRCGRWLPARQSWNPCWIMPPAAGR